MSKPEVEVVVKLEVEEIKSYSSIFIRWQRTIIGYVVRRCVSESVFDKAESVIEVNMEDQRDS